MIEGIEIERRLSAVESDRKDHSRVLTEYGQNIQSMLKRLDYIEDDMQARAVERAVAAEKEKQYQLDMSGIRKDVSDLKGVFTKILWAVGLAVLAAVVKWVLTGNLMS